MNRNIKREQLYLKHEEKEQSKAKSSPNVIQTCLKIKDNKCTNCIVPSGLKDKDDDINKEPHESENSLVM